VAANAKSKSPTAGKAIFIYGEIERTSRNKQPRRKERGIYFAFLLSLKRR
jgi:hypothetical protein